MRKTALLAAATLLLPVALSAQHIPMRGPRGVVRPQPAPLPPQLIPVAREQAYKRMRLSVETYPMVSYFQAPGLAGSSAPSWTSFGMGTHADYRLKPYTSLTFDVTSSFWGGPTQSETAELGTRIHRQRTNGVIYPFVDLRVGYMALGQLPTASNVDSYGNPIPGYTGWSDGFGALGGAGMEIGLSHRLSLTTAAAVMGTRMHVRSYDAGQFSSRNFGLTQYRYTIGLRYNPIKYVRPPGTIGP